MEVMRTKISREALFYILIGSAVYGYFIVLTKQGLTFGLDPLSFASMTSLLSAVFSLGILSPKTTAARKIGWKGVSQLLLIAFLGSCTADLMIYFGQTMTSAVNAGFLVKLTALTTIPFAFLIFRHKLRKIAWVPIFITILGVFLLSCGGKLEVPQFGDIIIIFGTIQLGFTNAYAKKVMAEFSSSTVAGFRLVFGALFTSGIVFLVCGNNVFSALQAGFVFVLFSGILHVVVIFTFYKTIALTNPTTAAMLFLLSALFSTFFAYLFLNESVGATAFFGGSLILIGLYLLLKLS